MKVKYGVWGAHFRSGRGDDRRLQLGRLDDPGHLRGDDRRGSVDDPGGDLRRSVCRARIDKQRLKELQAINSWERAAYIEKGGWDRMPGEEKASDTVSGHAPTGLRY